MKKPILTTGNQAVGAVSAERSGKASTFILCGIMSLHTKPATASTDWSTVSTLCPNSDAESDWGIAQGVLTHTTWATPVPPVLKPNASIHVCGDCKDTVNKEVQQNLCSIPPINQLLLSCLSKVFCFGFFAVLDLAYAIHDLA